MWPKQGVLEDAGVLAREQWDWDCFPHQEMGISWTDRNAIIGIRYFKHK